MSSAVTKRQTATDRRLAEIAEDLHSELVEAESQYQSAIGHALRAGELLVEAKSLVPRGSWGRWLAANFEGSQTVAHTYIRLAEHRVEIADARTITQAVTQIAPSSQAAAVDERNHEADPMSAYRLASAGIARALAHGGDWTPPDTWPAGYLPPSELRSRLERMLEIVKQWEGALHT